MAKIIGTNNGEMLNGTAVDDLIQGLAGNDWLYGQDGNDQLDGGMGDDFLDGGSGNDKLTGADGNDTLYGGGGKDQLDGGAGTDLLSLDLSGEGAGVVFDGARRTHLSLKNGTSAKNGEQFDVSGTNFGDTLVGANLDDRFSGNDGDDSLVGGAGNDQLYGGSGNDTLAGGVGYDTLYGGDGNDQLDGGTEIDFLDGGSGDDTIAGGAGYDTLYGGDGNDRVLYDAEDAFIDGGPGNDTIDASGSGAGVTIDLVNGPYSAFETIIGSVHDDNLVGNASANSLNGRAGNDILKGNGGSDTFVLSAGNDTIQDFEQAGSTTSVLLDFEGLFPGPLYSYQGLNWTAGTFEQPYVVLGDGSAWPPGAQTVLTSGTNVGAGTWHSSLSSADAAQDFDFSSGYFAAALDWLPTSLAKVVAHDDGAEVGSVELGLLWGVKAHVDFLSQTASGVDHATFSGRFESVDTIEFIPDIGPLPMDDLVLNYASQGDKIDVPDGFDVAGFIGSATSDGNGGTVLTHDQGSLQLIGIDPGTVSTDWFI